jgi:hypothetical protein
MPTAFIPWQLFLPVVKIRKFRTVDQPRVVDLKLTELLSYGDEILEYRDYD